MQPQVHIAETCWRTLREEAERSDFLSLFFIDQSFARLEQHLTKQLRDGDGRFIYVVDQDHSFTPIAATATSIEVDGCTSTLCFHFYWPEQTLLYVTQTMRKLFLAAHNRYSDCRCDSIRFPVPVDHDPGWFREYTCPKPDYLGRRLNWYLLEYHDFFAGTRL
ncbi:hypothetical protein KC906_00445, partial [Candidatus Kaiserbacteria bacterium]|nr:hypothetical protein [Candidatus Kaiserbacteria bacterium]